jgi:hypothetical protein
MTTYYHTKMTQIMYLKCNKTFFFLSPPHLLTFVSVCELSPKGPLLAVPCSSAKSSGVDPCRLLSCPPWEFRLLSCPPWEFKRAIACSSLFERQEQWRGPVPASLLPALGIQVTLPKNRLPHTRSNKCIFMFNYCVPLRIVRHRLSLER